MAPILAAKCAGCHRSGGIAPFPLTDARAIARRADAIAAAVAARLMPPWPPGPRSPAYAGEAERTLSARERATILAWARAGGRVDGPARPAPPPAAVEVREGESPLELRMPAAYRPRAAPGVADDYRCFLLDPGLGSDVAVTSARIEPGTPRVVHHVILFRVPPAQAGEAERLDASAPGPGWPCFGGTGIPAVDGPGSAREALEDAGWVAAWAPGFRGGRLPDGTGVQLAAGSRVVMQVHYNLANGSARDRSRALLTVAPASAGLAPLRTVLLPAPVELACAPGEQARLCDRGEALLALARRHGAHAGLLPAGLLLLCRGSAAAPRPSPVSTCERRLPAPATIHVVAGHMHLLGASIRLELNPGTARARVLLDIPRWDFHWQGAYTLRRPMRARAGDVVRVTCRHDVGKRLRGEEGVPRAPRYVLWGEGTQDEMCLGLLQVVPGR